MTNQNLYPALASEEIPAFQKAIQDALSDSRPHISHEEMKTEFRRAENKVNEAIKNMATNHRHAS